MADEFISKNTAPLKHADFSRAATALNCPVAAIQAVAEVESLGGGFQADSRPKILFERHWFHKLTDGKWSAKHSDISNSTSGGYLGGAKEYDRLATAISLDRTAALKSASWGAFQIMGFNHESAGYPDVEKFVAAMVESSAKQLDAFAAFIKANRLDGPLRRMEWANFAKGYNGSGYRKNKYDEKLTNAYAKHASVGTVAPQDRPTVKIGMENESVAVLQSRLGLKADGKFGPKTQQAVKEFQRSHKLVADGVVGRRTWSELLRNQSTPGTLSGPSCIMPGATSPGGRTLGPGNINRPHAGSASQWLRWK